ncbi:hypothetical protein H5410_010378 [Solanum commersonii]|uniref:Dynamin stalk domain-containing protein n=1 Tax=Solanum commersonii TaxID=4109 RepID=A0A9J6AKI6_SOLCO|nr:hypothetical protein H5410_010378 [Solanum commersonii]
MASAEHIGLSKTRKAHSPTSRGKRKNMIDSLYYQPRWKKMRRPMVNKLQDRFAQLGSHSTIELLQVPVVDIMMNCSIKDALVAEEKFFRSHPVCGVSQLTTREAFSSMMEGKNEEMSTSELSGGARNHRIFQDIFVKSLEEVDPCEDLTDDDIRTAIQKATGPKSAFFVPEMSHRCMVNELQRFPILRKRMHEMDCINTHLVGIKLMRWHYSRSRKVPTSERSLKSRAILARSVGGFIPDQVGLSASSSPCLVVWLAPVVEKTIASGSNVGSSWRISSIFGGSDNRPSIEDNFISKQFSDPVQSMDHAF